jgi:hypothetical protein
MKNRLDLADVNHLAVALDVRDQFSKDPIILKVVGYEEPVTDQEMMMLYEEMSMSPEFGMERLVPQQDFVIVRKTRNEMQELLIIEELLEQQSGEE